MSTMDVSVVLRLIDELTGPAKNASRSIEDMQKRLSDLTRVGQNGADILPKSLRQAAEAARLTGAEIQKLAQRYENVTRAIRGMKAAEGFKVHNNWVSLQIKDLDRLAAAAKRAEAAQYRAAGIKEGRGIIGSGVRMAAGYFGAHQAAKVAKTGIEQAFSAQQSIAMLQVGGERQGIIDSAVEQARKMAAANRQFSMAEHLHAIVKLRSAIGDTEEAIRLAPSFQRANAVLNAAKDVKPGLKNVHFEDQAYDLARALEIKGVTRMGEHTIESWTNAITKAMVGMSGQINAGDFHNTFKYGRAATRGWSLDFVQNYLPTLMNEFKSRGGAGGGVQGPGNALMSMYSNVVDGRMTKAARAQWQKMGLIGKDGKVVGRAEFIENPYLWAQKYLAEALKKKLGKKAGDETAILQEIGGLFGNRVAAQMAQILTIAKSQFEKDRDLIKKAMGADALEQMERSSPQAAMQGISAAWKDMLGAFAGPGTGPMLRTIHQLADAMRKIRGEADKPGFKEGASKLDQFLAGLFGQNRLDPTTGPAGKKKWTGEGDSPNFVTEHDGWFNFGERLKESFGKVGEAFEGWGSLTLQRWGAAWETAVGLWTNPAKQIGSGINSVADVIQSASNYLRDKLSWIPGFGNKQNDDVYGPWQHNFKPGTAPNLPGMLDPNTTVPDPSQKRWYQPKGERDYTLGNGTGGFSHGTRHTYGGIGQVTETFQEGLKQLPTATVPDLSDIGTRIMQSVSSGMQKSASVVTGQMSSLMASLQSIAAPGINIPIHADTGGVSGAVRGAIQKANAGSKSNGPVTINVQADPNPNATAQKVRTAFNDAVRDHLNDIG